MDATGKVRSPRAILTLSNLPRASITQTTLANREPIVETNGIKNNPDLLSLSLKKMTSTFDIQGGT